MGETAVFIMEIIGTVAFAVSGALIAAECGLDLFGVMFVGCITAVGGGMLRDVFIGNLPPSIFSNIPILCLAAITALVVFIISYVNAKKFDQFEKRLESINNFFDAVGLAAFSVTGTEIACDAGFSEMTVFSISMGILTGIGGGIIRDILVNKKPYVLHKRIYALASLLGSATYYFLRMHGSELTALLIAMPAVIIIRLLATKFRWKLPKIR